MPFSSSESAGRLGNLVKATGHFPTEQAALKCLYLVTRSLDPTGQGKASWAMQWKPALDAFAITFGDRSRPPGPTNPDSGNTVGEAGPTRLAEPVFYACMSGAGITGGDFRCTVRNGSSAHISLVAPA
jgi:hypothetical protein